MKKLIALVLTLALFFGINAFLVVNADSVNVQFNKTGLGYTLNTVKNAYIDVSEIKTGSPIFNEEWLENKISNLSPDIISTSDIKFFSSSSYKDISTSIGVSYNFNSNITNNLSLFNQNSSIGFNVYNNFEYNKYASQYYYTLISTFERYSYALPNYSSNLTDYKNNLHTDYVNALNNLFTQNTQTAANSFFDTYGTHLIAKGIYGGKAEIYYSIISNKVDINDELKTSITTEVNNSITGLIEQNKESKFDLEASLGISKSVCKESFRAITKGGNPFSATSISSLNASFSNWTNTIDSTPTLIKTSSDGLIPLWNLLPSSYSDVSYKNKLINWFSNYTNSYNNSVFNINDFNVDFSSYVDDSRLIRSSEYLIDDSGRFSHNKHDVINLKTFYNTDADKEETTYSYAVLKSLGFTKMKVVITLSMKEVDNGYQYICIYNSECNGFTDEQKDAHKVCPDIQYSYGGSDKKTTYGVVTFTFDDIPIEKFAEENIIVLRYGASGKNDDDWQNKDVYVQITYSK